ncbi:hypothetical protein HDU82_007537 [Entophlyctis luteolus]|nr:hypothetical protein HDU82_007537 [Entophlyctis luteolus]
MTQRRAVDDVFLLDPMLDPMDDPLLHPSPTSTTAAHKPAAAHSLSYSVRAFGRGGSTFAIRTPSATSDQPYSSPAATSADTADLLYDPVQVSPDFGSLGRRKITAGDSAAAAAAAVSSFKRGFTSYGKQQIQAQQNSAVPPSVEVTTAHNLSSITGPASTFRYNRGFTVFNSKSPPIQSPTPGAPNNPPCSEEIVPNPIDENVISPSDIGIKSTSPKNEEKGLAISPQTLSNSASRISSNYSTTYPSVSANVQSPTPSSISPSFRRFSALESTIANPQSVPRASPTSAVTGGARTFSGNSNSRSGSTDLTAILAAMERNVSVGMREFLASIPGLPVPFILPKKLAESYQLQGALGEGATGFVVSGRRIPAIVPGSELVQENLNNSSGEEVAVKFVFKDRINNVWKKDFETGLTVPMEVFVMRRLKHDNIVGFYESFEDGVFVYIVMEAVKHISFQSPFQSEFSPTSSTSSLISLTQNQRTPEAAPGSAEQSQTATPTISNLIPPKPMTSPDSMSITAVHHHHSHQHEHEHHNQQGGGRIQGPQPPPAAPTNLTSPRFAIPHPHDIGSPSFPLLVKLNSKIDLTVLGKLDEDTDLAGGKEHSPQLSDSEDALSVNMEQADVETKGNTSASTAIMTSRRPRGMHGFVVGGDEDSESDADLSALAGSLGSNRGTTGTWYEGMRGRTPSNTASARGSGAGGSRVASVAGSDSGGAGGGGSSTRRSGTATESLHVAYRAPAAAANKTAKTSPVVGDSEANSGGHLAAHSHVRRRAHSKDLFEFVERAPQMDENVAMFIFKQVAEAVKYLHSKGFVHRDIKDENVIIDNSMRVKLVDFGAAMSIPRDRVDYFTDFVGTMTYAPPECCPLVKDGQIEPYRGPEQDVWSLGVLLFVLLQTRTPFLPDALREARMVRPTLVGTRSEAAKDLLFKMMEPDVSARISMDEVCVHPWLVR